jgi:hypothetical protein
MEIVQISIMVIMTFIAGIGWGLWLAEKAQKKKKENRYIIDMPADKGSVEMLQLFSLFVKDLTENKLVEEKVEDDENPDVALAKKN